MKKYQITIKFHMDSEFMELVPSHRTYINYLINKEVSTNMLSAWKRKGCGSP